jgi:tetratricopeptide (TPR) repeat protein
MNSLVFRRVAAVLAFAWVGIHFSGCAAFRKSGWDASSSTSDASIAEAKKKIAQGLGHWAKRDQKAELEKALKLFEEAAEADPTNLDNLVLLTRGFYLMADTHIADTDERKKVWDQGTAWGERALATNEGFRKKVKDEGQNVEDALDTLTKREVPALYWTAVNLGKWAKLSGLGTMLKYKNRIKMMVERVEALDALYFHGAVPRYWGTYYAVAPSFAGGSMEKSLKYYKQSLELAPTYFGTHVLYAENYATRKSDRELFRKHLDIVLKGKPESLPGLEPEQRLEQIKAKKMLETMEEFF